MTFVTSFVPLVCFALSTCHRSFLACSSLKSSTATYVQAYSVAHYNLNLTPFNVHNIVNNFRSFSTVPTTICPTHDPFSSFDTFVHSTICTCHHLVLAYSSLESSDSPCPQAYSFARCNLNFAVFDVINTVNGFSSSTTVSTRISTTYDSLLLIQPFRLFYFTPLMSFIPCQFVTQIVRCTLTARILDPHCNLNLSAFDVLHTVDDFC